MKRTTLLAFLMFAGLIFASPVAAKATLRVCNATAQPVAVAIADQAQGAKGGLSIHSEGWFQINSQTCANVVDKDLDPGAQYYLYAKSVEVLWSGSAGRSSRDAAFCTNFAGGFAYTDRTGTLCSGAGEQMLWFINEPVAAPTWTIELDTP